MSYTEPITRDAATVLDALRAGKSATEVSRQTGYHRWSILRLAKIKGVEVKRGKPGCKPGQRYTKKWGR